MSEGEISRCVRICLFISFFLLRPKRKKRNQRKKKRCQNEIWNFSSETLKVAMLLRVSTKKLRFRNRVNDFIRPHFEYRGSPPPRRSERKRRVFEATGFLFEDSVCCVSALRRWERFFGFASTTISLQNDGRGVE